MDPFVAEGAAEIAARAPRELEALVGVSSPSGDVDGAEEALAVCAALLPPQADIERVPCSTPGSAPDLIARITGRGAVRLLLLGHVDTVIGHSSHTPLRREGDRLYGPGTVDMKGGVVLSLGVARALASRPETFAELSLLLVTDEEWRRHELLHVERFAGYDACLCFEGGQLSADGDEGVVVKRKAAGTMRVGATGRAAHSGSAPDQGRNALLALAATAIEVARRQDPDGPEHLSVVPTILRSGDAFNVVPAEGELPYTGPVGVLIGASANPEGRLGPLSGSFEPASRNASGAAGSIPPTAYTRSYTRQASILVPAVVKIHSAAV